MACVLTIRLSEGTPKEDSVGCNFQGRAVDLGWECGPKSFEGKLL